LLLLLPNPPLPPLLLKLKMSLGMLIISEKGIMEWDGRFTALPLPVIDSFLPLFKMAAVLVPLRRFKPAMPLEATALPLA
jgi:hypothetical protein